MSQNHIFLEWLSSEIEIAILQTKILARIDLILDFEGGRLGSIQDLEICDLDLDLTGRELCIFHSLRSWLYLSFDRENPFTAEFLTQLMGFWIDLGVKDNLCDSLSVTKIHKNKPTMVATGGDPTHEDNLLAGIDTFQFATMMSPFHGGKLR